MEGKPYYAHTSTVMRTGLDGQETPCVSLQKEKENIKAARFDLVSHDKNSN